MRGGTCDQEVSSPNAKTFNLLTRKTRDFVQGRYHIAEMEVIQSRIFFTEHACLEVSDRIRAQAQLLLRQAHPRRVWRNSLIKR
jgi:hypothetical protein